MKTSINLVSTKRRPSEFHRRFFIIAIIFFSIVFIFSAGLIGYRFFLQSQLNSLKTDEAELISEVNINPEKKIKFLTVRERLSEIQKIISARKNINDKIETVAQTLPQDVEISLIGGDSEEIKLRVTASDLLSLDSLIEQRIAEYANENKREVKRVEMTSFRLNADSLLYEANFTIEFI